MLSKTFAEVRTIEQALDAKAPSFGKLVRQGDCTKGELEGLIMAHLSVIDAYLKQKTPLSVEEIQDIAEEVVAKYYWVLTFADVHLIFRNARNGVYGELYNSLTAAKVLDWFAQYEQERCKKCEERAQSRSKEERPVYSNEELVALGYRINERGQMININPQTPQKKKPMRYTYDEKGNIKGENPAYFKNVQREKTTEEIESMNLFNRKLERARELQAENPDLPFINAFAKAEIEIKESQDNE